MNPRSFDRISRRFAERRLPRRQARAAGQEADATPAATPDAVPVERWGGEKTTYLFVQSFRSGTITPSEEQDGRFTVTLEHGTGQTVYFGDRPSRDVGVTETPQFLEGLGFSPEDPPNAALIVETALGETDTAVVELYNPTYDPTTQGVTYDVEVLGNWEDDLELGLREATADLATLAPEFGAAHLLIDDCPSDSYVDCNLRTAYLQWEKKGVFHHVDYCWNYLVCMPCEPHGHVQPDRCATHYYWEDRCNATFPDCQGKCEAWYAWPAVDFNCIESGTLTARESAPHSALQI